MSFADFCAAEQLAYEMLHVLNAEGLSGAPRLKDIIVGRDPIWITLTVELWTISLVRKTEVPVTFLAAHSDLRDRARHRDVAVARTARYRKVQRRRHRIATAHGLTLSHQQELDPLDLLMDRTTAACLRHAGVGLPGLVQHYRNSADDVGDEDEQACWAPSPLRRDFAFSVRFRETGAAPILKCELPIRGAKLKSELRHDVHVVEATLPDTVLVAASGRRLGDLVATGMPTLDLRRILGAAQSCGFVSFTLEPDLITISEAMMLSTSS